MAWHMGIADFRPERCKTCQWWICLNSDIGSGYECRRRAPITNDAVKDGAHWFAREPIWPMTYGRDACGDWVGDSEKLEVWWRQQRELGRSDERTRQELLAADAMRDKADE